MGRTVTSAMLQEMFAQQTDQVFILLVTIDHDDLSQPIRICSDSQNIDSNGDTYVALPFQFGLPDESDSGSTRARLKIDNVDRSIVAAVRQLQTTPIVQMQIIRADAPDVVEVDFPQLRFSSIGYSALIVEGELSVEDFMQEPYPTPAFVPSLFPGLF
ncbi:hypothetical protein LCGC14_2745900 [marine sediment metagenome]|uniref:DUF1833 domain-containing protein n=1 Tax=marine sediment metagenome TaxID=412755 RepID=A0A0F9BUU5_9ZZZZ